MDYQVALSPNLDLSPAKFVMVWNETMECRAVAEAFFPPSDPLLRNIVLNSVRADVPSAALYDLIKHVLVKQGVSEDIQVVQTTYAHDPPMLAILTDEVHRTSTSSASRRLLIRIQEHSGYSGPSNATVSFGQGPEYPILIENPFSEEDEKELEWYFEEHLAFPFTRKVRAQRTAESITTYGEKLFKQVFASNASTLVAYKTAVQLGLNTLQFEILGSPEFHRLHWEALKDPSLPLPLALQATMVRKSPYSQIIGAAVHSSPTINVLIVTARPRTERDVAYRAISRPLVEELRQANLPIQIEILRPGTYKALHNHLSEISTRYGTGYYHVIHFDMRSGVLTYRDIQQGEEAGLYLHSGRYGRADIQAYEGSKAFLLFEDEQENVADLVETTEVAKLLNHQVPIVITAISELGKNLSIDETNLGSLLMQAGVQAVLVMSYSVTVNAMELMTRILYRELFAGYDLPTAILHARQSLYNHKKRRAYFDQKIDLEDWLLPVVYQNQLVKLQPREFTPKERSTWFERKAEEARFTPPEPTYGFIGRDIDILKIEKRLQTRCNILLIRGMGGAGKTTLLKHLGTWWYTTGFVQRVFYFNYDVKAWTLQQIMAEIAQQLYGPKYYIDFQPLSLKAQQAMLTQSLRAADHLLILDNLESITGAHLAIQHTLPKNEQETLRNFLADLVKGHTLVLLGSRGGEDWLATGTFEDNIYDLPGLDPEAATTLADRILGKIGTAKYREDENLRTIINVLGGFPLALEVVLANLKQQTPQEILAALQAGDVRLNIPESEQQGKSIFEQKTESILRCIDYSHSNLSPEAQQLLLCLAPFTSVVWLDMLDNYIACLKQQPALAVLPFDRWLEVIHEAQNWALMSPDPDMPRFLRLQPIFPYFLRNRLHEPARVEVKSAIETAFCQHYDQVGGELFRLLESKEPQERTAGQVITGLEYENLVMVLELSLENQFSILNSYRPLSVYLDITEDQRRGLELSQTVLKRLDDYPVDKFVGSLGAELVGVIDDIAKRQFLLKQYILAEASYQQALRLALQLEHIDGKLRGSLLASIYHQLGMVNQERREWYQAEYYYQQALQIKTDQNDRYEQAGTYHQLGRLAQGQEQWAQAELYYQRALQIYVEFNDRYEQAGTYHQLGRLAQGQEQWAQAELYYQRALQIYVEFNDRHSQASTYYQLGILAQKQKQWAQAEQYYQPALQILIEFNDRYSQASIYGQLGLLAQDQQQWQQAGEYLLQALQIFVECNDNYSADIALRNLARLWSASDVVNVHFSIANALGKSVEETEKLLREALGEQEDKKTGDRKKRK